MIDKYRPWLDIRFWREGDGKGEGNGLNPLFEYKIGLERQGRREIHGDSPLPNLSLQHRHDLE